MGETGVGQQRDTAKSWVENLKRVGYRYPLHLSSPPTFQLWLLVWVRRILKAKIAHIYRARVKK